MEIPDHKSHGDTQATPLSSAPSNPASAAGSTPSEEQSRVIGRLEGEVDVLRDQVATSLNEMRELREKLDKPKGRLDRVSAGIALIAVLFSLVKAPSEFVAAYLTRTDTTLFPDSQIAVHYDPTTEVFEIRWKIDARNDGKKLDVIDVAEATIVMPQTATVGQAQNAFDFYSASGAFRSVDAAETVPARDHMFIKEKESGSYFCILSRRASPQEIQDLAESGPSRRCIRVTLKGTDRTYSLTEGCFDLLPEDAETILRGARFLIAFDSSVH